MADPVKRFTMQDSRITTEPWKQKYCPNCWGKKIYQHDEVCKECKRELRGVPNISPEEAGQLMHNLRKQQAAHRQCCERCGNQLSNQRIKYNKRFCLPCEELQ